MTYKEYVALFRIVNSELCNGRCNGCKLEMNGECLLAKLQLEVIDKGIFPLAETLD